MAPVTQTSEHELLLRHFSSWADKKRRTPDLRLMDELLSLRSAYDGLEPTYWPAGSVEDLLLGTWPAKGPVEAPDPEAVVETVDAFVRFLRGTGRMASRSAAPADLAKEARRAARELPAAAADRRLWSPTKQMMDFAQAQGIDFTDVPDIETLQARLDEAQAMWNALPFVERRRLAPRPGDPDPEADLSGLDRARLQFGTADRVLTVIELFAGDLPGGDLPAEEDAAACFGPSAYAQQMWALARWVGDGKEITATRVLRPALAKQAYADLALGAWQRSQLERTYPDERLPGVAAVGRDAWIEQEMARPWRSAADCQELHRLWLGAVGCEAVLLDGKRAAYSGEGSPDVERTVDAGVRAVISLLDHLAASTPGGAEALVWALMRSYVGRGARVTREEALAWWQQWTWRPSDLEYFGDSLDQYEAPHVDAALGLLGDTGVYDDDGEAIALTPFGDTVVSAWLGHLQEVGLID